VFLSVLLLFGSSVVGQLIKIKDDSSCGSELSSNARASSLFILQKVSNMLYDSLSLKDCFKACHLDTSCAFSAHHEVRKECLFFTGLADEESISRLMAEGWKYGKVNSKNMVSIFE